jgi:hypothetical protein
MNPSIEDYLSQLKDLMKGRDPAILRDALADAEEHLRSAMEGQPPSALANVIEEYGTPEETASAYEIMEERSVPGLSPVRSSSDRNWIVRFFSVLVDPRAWGAVLYMLLSLVTCTLYFTWAVTGLSLSLSMIVMIFGIPLAALILLSFRGLALLEGRIVEALLGVRMPRRPVFTRKDVTLIEKLKTIFGSRVTWFSALYLLLDFPLGIIYFCLIITLFAVALSLFAMPVLQYGFHLPVYMWNGVLYTFQAWSMPLFVLAGILVFTFTMHIAKGLGWLHGKFARALLVAE